MAFRWSHTFDVTTRKVTVEQALERIDSMLTRAYFGAQAARRGVADAQATFNTHFINTAAINSVIAVIERVCDRVSRSDQFVNMAYIENAADYATIAAKLGLGPLPAAIGSVEAFVVPSHPNPDDAATLFICPSFFTGDTYIPNAVNIRTGTGTIVHELTHMVGRTGDHAYTWDAANYPNLTAAQRADNADTYRAYCQSFDNPLHIPGV